MRSGLIALLLLLTTFAHAHNPSDLRAYGQPTDTTLYLFTAPSCPHCAVFHKNVFPELIKKYVNTKRAQILIVDMPTDPNTLKAVLLLHCLPPEKSDRFMTWLYQKQSEWIDSSDVRSVFLPAVRQLGMSASDMDKCLTDVDLKDDIIDTRNHLRSLYNVNGTPTIAMRQGNVVKLYMGNNRRAILSGLEIDINKGEGLKKAQ